MEKYLYITRCKLTSETSTATMCLDCLKKMEPIPEDIGVQKIDPENRCEFCNN